MQRQPRTIDPHKLLELLAPDKRPIEQYFMATVTQAEPLRIKLDGDPEPLPITPHRAAGPSMLPGDRVLCKFHGRRIIVLIKFGSAENGLPAGAIVMWSGEISAIPPGWALCNGQNGTPDLRDRFIMGTGNNAEIGNTGGNHQVNLNVNQLPSHNHPASTNTTGNHHHTGRWRSFSISSGSGFFVVRRVHSSDSYDGTDQITHAADGNHTHTVSVGNTGNGAAIDIRPKYYQLALIMKL